MAQEAAARTSASGRIEEQIETVLPGNTVVVLKSGARISGQVLPRVVRRRRNEVDADGRPIYDVEWGLTTITLPQEGEKK